MRKLIPLLITCFVAAGLASCDVTGEESFGFKEGNSLVIVGPTAVAIDSTGSYYSKGFTINKEYTWNVAEAPDSWYKVRREGEYLDFTPAELGFYTITVEDTEGYAGETTVDVTDFIPGEVADEGYTLLEDAIQQAGLTDTLASKTATYTIFAPNNAAMLEEFDDNDDDAIDVGEYPANLEDILWHHVVLNGPSSSGLTDGIEYTTGTEEGSGSAISVTVTDECEEDDASCKEDVIIDQAGANAKVVATDSTATNGIVHGIDAVLMP